jgi:hypothetical protein
MDSVLLEKLIVTQLVKKFPSFYDTRKFITVFIITHHWYQCGPRWILFPTSQTIPPRSILILSSHPHLGSYSIRNLLSHLLFKTLNIWLHKGSLSSCFVWMWNVVFYFREAHTHEGVSKNYRTGRLELQLQMIQLSATRCSCIAILCVSLVSFVAIILCVTSQRVFIVVSVYFVIDSVRKIWIHPRTFQSLRKNVFT